MLKENTKHLVLSQKPLLPKWELLLLLFGRKQKLFTSLSDSIRSSSLVSLDHGEKQDLTK